jgi:hypothetical protein
VSTSEASEPKIDIAPVPEISITKHDDLVASKDNVRATSDAGHGLAVANSSGPDGAPKQKLALRIALLA